ncbi:8336_t:CDS:2 [Gigaspora margarita]|uniref:8336_t:CDS:1 n=1 Tax=Gigaspora margarita TaxID=4874 RepID=A0ABN7VZU9_GIGMA|nr:8336_t:CDS:2 [Gigaspora margarita]
MSNCPNGSLQDEIGSGISPQEEIESFDFTQPDYLSFISLDPLSFLDNYQVPDFTREGSNTTDQEVPKRDQGGLNCDHEGFNVEFDGKGRNNDQEIFNVNQEDSNFSQYYLSLDGLINIGEQTIPPSSNSSLPHLDNIKVNNKDPSGKKYGCEQCNYRCKYPYELKRHSLHAQNSPVINR